MNESMELKIEKITATNKNAEGFKQVWIRRDAKFDKGNGGSAVLNILMGSNFDKPGRLAFAPMADAMITQYGVEVGKDLNALLPEGSKLAVKVFETTEPEAQAESIRLSLKPKTNGDDVELTKNGKTIYHVTLIVLETEYDGDTLVAHDVIS